MARNVKGSLFFGIIITTLVGIPMGVTEVPQHWLPVSMPQSLSPVFCKFQFDGLLSFRTVMVVVSLLLVNIFDTVGTLVGLAYKTNIVKSDGTIPHVNEAMMSDALGTTIGSLLGTSTITTYVESASGIAEGGRSGLTSFAVGILFLVSLFLAPVFMLIPGAATSGALVMVGVLMLDNVKRMDLSTIDESFPAFITMITMVLCYSIADGICLGILSYVAMKLCVRNGRISTPPCSCSASSLSSTSYSDKDKEIAMIIKMCLKGFCLNFGKAQVPSFPRQSTGNGDFMIRSGKTSTLLTLKA